MPASLHQTCTSEATPGCVNGQAKRTNFAGRHTGLHLFTRSMTDVHWNQSQYSAQMCITAMQAQVSMLMKHHQLISKYDADPSSPNTVSSASTVSIGLSCAEHQCKNNWLTLAEYGS